VYNEEKNILYCADYSSKQQRQDSNLLYWRDKPNEPKQGRTLFICTPQVPIAEVSTDSRGNLFSLSGPILFSLLVSGVLSVPNAAFL
jgi:hypothetical protein